MDRDEQRSLAGRALVAKVLADLVAREVKTTRKALEPSLLPGEDVKGVLPDGTIVGEVQYSEQPISVVVTDEKALMEYVRRNRPDEIVTVEYIRESYLNHLKALAREQLVEDTYGGDVVDAQGEIVPGLDLDLASPRYTPRPSTRGRKAIEAALARLLGPDLADRLELPTGPRAVP
jgi:hypothetical protein